MAENRERGHEVWVVIACLAIVCEVGMCWALWWLWHSSLPPEEAKTVVVTVEKPAEAEVPAQPASRLAQMIAAGEVRSIRLVGDSITAGFGTDGYALGSEEDGSAVVYDDGMGTVHFESSLSASCWANAFRAYATSKGISSFVNAGINGAFMAELADDPEAWLQGGADVIFVALGTNDAGYYGVDEYRAAAEAGLAAAAEKSKLVVALAPVRDLRPTDSLVEPASQLGDVLREVCDAHGYEFVDPRDAVTPDLFCDDGLHPNSQGSLAIWSCIQQILPKS